VNEEGPDRLWIEAFKIDNTSGDGKMAGFEGGVGDIVEMLGTPNAIDPRFGYSLNESEHPPVKGGDKLMRWGNGDIASLNDRLDNGFATGKFISTENAVKYSRTKWNRLDWDEQRKYAVQMNRQVTKYNVMFKDESFVSVPKSMYDQIRLPELPAKNYWQNYSA